MTKLRTMNLEKLKCWSMIIIAAVIIGLTVSQCVMASMCDCNISPIKIGAYIVCAIIGIAYIIKYARILKKIDKE